MAREQPPRIANQYYHIYNRAIADHLLFKEDRNYVYFLSRTQKYLSNISDILSYCLMPNHYHLILKLKTNDLSCAMHKLALSYVVSFNRAYGQKGHLFQGTYQRKHITDLSYLLHLSRYIHLNPVKARLVKKAEQWDYSSYQDYVGMRNTDFINPKPILDLISDKSNIELTAKQQAYRIFVEERYFERD